MANWLIDIANQKRGTAFLRHVDNVKNHAIGIVDGSPQVFSQIAQPFRTHSAVDPRNAKLFNTDSGYGIGLSNDTNEVVRSLELDTIKNYLDANPNCPTISLAYIFASPDENVTTRHAIENSKYITTIYDNDATATNVVDIETGDILWNTPTQKDIQIYLFAGKIKGVPDTYYLVLNSLRTEMYETLNDTANHKFEHLDLGVGAISDFLIMPTFENATLESEDVVLATDAVFYMNPFTKNEFYENHSVDLSQIRFRVRSNCVWEQVTPSRYKFNLGDKTSGVVVFEIENNLLEQDPELRIQKVFKVYKV